MKAILAILVDSYREAAASRVLWVALAGIAILLLALAPLSLDTGLSDALRNRDVVNFDSFASAMNDQRNQPATPAAHIWSLLSKQDRTTVESWVADTGGNDAARAENLRRRHQREAVEILNGLIGRAEFFHAASWAEVSLPDDLAETTPDQESVRQLRHRNLKRLAAAFPRSFRVSDEAILTLAYAGIPVQIPIPVSPGQIDTVFNGAVVFVLSTFLGFFGIFASLLVTAGLIPRTFEPGEISLLLSKPVRRWVLFNTKFVGGCMFTFFCATLLVGGVVMLLWLRFDRWRPELLWCVPLYVFLFAIYFSVSALAGAIWRNPIVSLSFVVAFWVVITVAGVVEGLMGLYLTSQQIVNVTVAGDEVFMTDMQRLAYRWDVDGADWTPVLTESGGDAFGRAMQNVTGGGRRPRVLVSADGRTATLFNPVFSRGSSAVSANVIAGTADDAFEGEKKATTTTPVLDASLTRDGRLIVAGTSGVFEFAGANEQEQRVREFLNRRTGGLISAGTASAFKSLTNREYPAFPGVAVVTIDPVDGAIIYADKGKLTRSVRGEDGNYSVATTRNLGDRQTVLLAAASGILAIAGEDGSIRICDAATLADKSSDTFTSGEQPRAVEVAPNGQFVAVLSHGSEVVVCNVESGTWTRHEAGVTDGTSVIGFDAAGSLLISDGRRTLRAVHPETLEVVRRYSGSTGLAAALFDHLIHPLYVVLPKPSELDHLVQWIVTGEKTVAINDSDPDEADGSSNLQQTRITVDLWRSFWSNVAFVGVMLLSGCLYLGRRDF